MASDKGKKDGGFPLKRYTNIFYKACILLHFRNRTSKRYKRGPDFSPEKALTYSSRVEAEVRIRMNFCSLKHVTSDCMLLFLCIQQVDDGCQNAARLVVENIDQWQRIVSLTHDDGHFGVS